MNRPTSTALLPLLATAFLLLFAATGCRSVPVDIRGLDAPDSLRVGQPGTFSVTVNEEAKQPVAYNWSFDDGTTADGSLATHSFDAEGTYTIGVTATNRKGKSTDQATTSVRVYVPISPARLVTVTATPLSTDTRTPVQFEARGNGTSPLTYTWTFGDGATATGATAQHTFARPGTYTVNLQVANTGGTDSGAVTVNVVPYEAAICRDVTEMNAVFFDRNSSTLTDAGRAGLEENLAILSECPNMSARVTGWAAPSERNAQRLSEDRVRAVAEYYTSQGISPTRVTEQGMGRVAGQTSRKEDNSQYRRVDTSPIRR